MRRSSLPTWLSVLALVALLGGCSAIQPKRFTQPQSPHRLTDCSSAPHCVSSQADKTSSHYVAPFTYRGSAEHARQVLLRTLRASDHATVQRADPRFVHATFRSSLFGFVDDVTFIINPERHVIDVKSSARVGFYDFGVNRRRVQRLRGRFESSLKSS